MMQPLGPFFSAKAFAPRSFSAWLYVPFPLIVHAIKPVAYALVGDHWPLGSWWHVHKTLVQCTTAEPSSTALAFALALALALDQKIRPPEPSPSDPQTC